MTTTSSAMLIGLDVGGTNTDAVLIDAFSGIVVDSVKSPTRSGDVLPGIIEALSALLWDKDAALVRRVSVSTTLGLNAILSGSTIPVGMLVVPGPGIDPRLFWQEDPLLHVLSGAQDHRGRIISNPPEEEVFNALKECQAHAAGALGIVCKFSPKNPELERSLAGFAAKELGDTLPIVCGSSIRGSLNFPRRMHTAWCAAALTHVMKGFIQGLERSTRELGLTCPLVVLKADAGVFSAAGSVHDPAGSIGSGAAASLLGVWALSGGSRSKQDGGDTLMIDMGGTTTDLAFLAHGEPLLAPGGLTVGGRPTLIRSLWTRSIALGGDSSLRIEQDGRLTIGPDRLGPALSLTSEEVELENRPPTLTDALNVLQVAALGNADASFKAMARLARQANSPGSDAQSLSRMFVNAALTRIRSEADSLLEEVNSQPVYTIRELLVPSPLKPGRAVFIGGPAKSLAGEVQRALGLPVFVPEASSCANAVGAALARPTQAAELYADTQLGRMRIPEMSIEKAITASYSLDDAKKDMMNAFLAGGLSQMDRAKMDATDVQIIYAESFATLDDRGRRGRNIRVRAQKSAGLLDLGAGVFAGKEGANE